MFSKSLLISAFLITGCSLLSKSSDASKKPETFFKKSSQGSLTGPCVNLPFVDQNFPEKIHESIRLFQPKVGVKTAYKITAELLEKENKRENYTIDTKSAKLCKVSNEFGYSFKVIKTQND